MATVRGLIARCDDRGLGYQTWDAWQSGGFDRCFVLREPRSEAAGFPPHLDRYPGAPVITLAEDGTVAEDDWPTVEAFMADCCVVYTAETIYDRRLADLADRAGTRIVVHVNPELFRPDLLDHPAVRLWLPTPWLSDRHPGVPVVPVPTHQRPVILEVGPDTPPLVVHVAGKPAAGDRNGTHPFLAALRLVTQPIRVRVTCQGGRLPAWHPSPAVKDVEVWSSNVNDRWALYEAGDLLVMPRRYGGLCLPIQEAASAGLAVAAPATPPHDWYPAELMVARSSSQVLRTASGDVELHDVAARTIAATINRLAADRAALLDARRRAVLWARDRSWDSTAGERFFDLLDQQAPCAHTPGRST